MIHVTYSEWMRWSVHQIVDGSRMPVAAFHMLNDAEIFASVLRDAGVAAEVVEVGQAAEEAVR